MPTYHPRGPAGLRPGGPRPGCGRSPHGDYSMAAGMGASGGDGLGERGESSADAGDAAPDIFLIQVLKSMAAASTCWINPLRDFLSKDGSNVSVGVRVAEYAGV